MKPLTDAMKFEVGGRISNLKRRIEGIEKEYHSPYQLVERADYSGGLGAPFTFFCEEVQELENMIKAIGASR